MRMLERAERVWRVELNMLCQHIGRVDMATSYYIHFESII